MSARHGFSCGTVSVSMTSGAVLGATDPRVVTGAFQRDGPPLVNVLRASGGASFCASPASFAKSTRERLHIKILPRCTDLAGAIRTTVADGDTSNWKPSPVTATTLAS